MKKYLFKDIVIGDDGLLRGPFGSDLKKSLFVDKGNDTYKVYIQDNIFKENSDVGDYYISNEYFKQKMFRYEVKKGDFIVTCDGTLGEIYQLNDLKEKGIISSSLLRITLDNSKVDNNYFYYLFKYFLKKKLITKGNNSVLKHLPGISVIKNLEIELPELTVQKKVGNILKSFDDLIKKNKAIVNEYESLAELIYDKNILSKCTNNPNVLNTYNEVLHMYVPNDWKVLKSCTVSEITTGKEDANFSDVNGKYNFFTCSSETLKCNKYEYNISAILIAGNGDFNVKHYTGKFNAYQRTYVLNPKDSKYYGVLYLGAKKMIKNFKNNSNGSIVKFIKKGDIENINIIDCNKSSIYDTINSLIMSSEKILEEIENLKDEQEKYVHQLLLNQIEF